jgi:hypothetical protein
LTRRWWVDVTVVSWRLARKRLRFTFSKLYSLDGFRSGPSLHLEIEPPERG